MIHEIVLRCSIIGSDEVGFSKDCNHKRENQVI
jgi:hypothetical protein